MVATFQVRTAMHQEIPKKQNLNSESRNKRLLGFVWYVAFAAIYFLVALLSVRTFREVGWVYGYFVISLLLGHLIAGAVFLLSGVKDQSWSSTLTGFVERTFFFVAVYNNVGGAAVAIIGWTTLKNLTYWKEFFGEQSERSVKNFHLVVMASLISPLFSMLGAIFGKHFEVMGPAKDWFFFLLF